MMAEIGNELQKQSQSNGKRKVRNDEMSSGQTNKLTEKDKTQSVGNYKRQSNVIAKMT